MSLSHELTEAMAEKVPLMLGQRVEVRSRSTGAVTATGYIQELNQETNTARVMDQGSGSDNAIDVDLDLYELWVSEPEIPGTAPTPSKQPKLNANPRKPGAHTGGTFDV